MVGKLKGFAAGLLVGMLLAPRAGRETRRRLMERLDDFFEMGSEELDALEEELAHEAGGSPRPPADPLPAEALPDDLGE